jgi:hypothetical protein
LRPVERQVSGRREPLGRRREAERADQESIREPLDHGTVGVRERAADEIRARALLVGELHAARIVDEDAHDVLLRDGGLHDEHGTEDAEEDDGERGETQQGERRPLAPLHARSQHAVADERDRHGDDHDGSGHRRTGRRGESKITLAEDGESVLEQELEQRFEHGRILSDYDVVKGRLAYRLAGPPFRHRSRPGVAGSEDPAYRS